MASVQGNISRVGGFEVCRHLITIAVSERVGHQRIAVPLTLMYWIDADGGEVPVRLSRVVFCRLLQYGEDVPRVDADTVRLHDSPQHFLVGKHTR